MGITISKRKQPIDGSFGKKGFTFYRDRNPLRFLPTRIVSRDQAPRGSGSQKRGRSHMNPSTSAR